MSEIETIIRQAREALSENDAKKALRTLKPLKKSLNSTNASNVMLHQLFADAYLENGQLDKAYPLLVKACKLDMEGTQGGSEKFFTLGQVTGGQDGLNMLMQGVQNVSQQAGDNLNQEQMDQIVSGLLSMIEIWMTDLCMEANAEAQCEELIAKSLEICNSESPEVWSTLGSIRISQQNYKEASEAFVQSWKFFEIKKHEIEESLHTNMLSSHEEYVQLLQPFLALAKMCIEMGLYEVSLKIVNAIKDIDEDNLEAHYLEGFTYYLIGKLEMFKLTNPEANVNVDNIYEFNEHFQELPLDLNNEAISEIIHEARLALSLASKIGENCDPADEVVSELVSGTREVLTELGGPLDTKELIKIKKGEDADEEGSDELELDLEIMTNEEKRD